MNAFLYCKRRKAGRSLGMKLVLEVCSENVTVLVTLTYVIRAYLTSK